MNRILYFILLFPCVAYSGKYIENYSKIDLGYVTFNYNSKLFNIDKHLTDQFIAAKTYKKLPDSFLLKANLFLTKSSFQTPQDFLIFWRKMDKEKKNNDTRHHLIKSDIYISQELGLFCVRNELKLIDLKSTHYTSLNPYITVFGFVCRHPYYENLILDINYSVRNESGAIDKFHKQLGESFIKSVVFKRNKI